MPILQVTVRAVEASGDSVRFTLDLRAAADLPADPPRATIAPAFQVDSPALASASALTAAIKEAVRAAFADYQRAQAVGIKAATVKAGYEGNTYRLEV